MKEITATGLTVDEAVQSALKDLNAEKSDVEIRIIDEGKKGFLGIFGQKPAIVHVKLKKDPVKDTVVFLKDVIAKMGVEADISVKKDGREVTFTIEGSSIATLIGKRGQTLNALQYLTQLAANKCSDHYLHVTVDAEGYRSRREETLIQLANRLAEQAIKTANDVKLEPMPSNERKVIHAALVKNKKIKTYSVGEEPKRHLVISPVNRR
ncbi:protein jag [Metabacillus sp. GX 13764]|uniref:RNA-binding cell elongation regulator Jag/EloR n=1 Tax=Metabacillus kandeliae TaxID=2900151 RepID=UPI001E5CCC25|nr:protein jag [Metabacillus kandeliae]